MIPTQIEKLRQMMADAPAGPWLVRHYPGCAPLIKMATNEIQELPNWMTAELIVAMHAALPALLRIAESLPSLRRKHDQCDDPWYSCPKSEDGCINESLPKDYCNCGADAHNARIDTALLALDEEGGRE